MASKAIGFLNFKFGADLSGFERAMKKAQKGLKKFGKNIQKTGQSLTTGLTLPILAFGAVAVKAFDEQQKAIAQVEAGLKSTGNQVGITSEQLQKMAADLQKTTLFGDEEILKGATAQLLTFTNIVGEQFERTQKVALDLATRLDGDLKSASIMLGKALNDPVANLSALSRAGIQFSTEQKETIKALVETNRLADAQTIILKELEKQYGGSAEAAAKAGMGPIKQLMNQFSDITEQIGERLIPHVKKLAEWITGLAEKFDGLTKEQKDNIVKWGLIVAAIGPVLIIFGKMAVGIVALSIGFGKLRKALVAGRLAMIVFGKGFVRLTKAGWAANGALGAVSGMLRALKIAMIANPITALVGGLSLAVGAFLTYRNAANDASQANDEFDGSVETLAEKMDRLHKLADDVGKGQFDLGIEEITEEIKKFEREGVGEKLISILDPMRATPSGMRTAQAHDIKVNELKDLRALLSKLKIAQKESNNVSINAVKINGKLSESTGELTTQYDGLSNMVGKYWDRIQKFSSIEDQFKGIVVWTKELTTSQKLLNASMGMFGDIVTQSLTSALDSGDNFFESFLDGIKKAIRALLVQLAVMTAIQMLMGNVPVGGLKAALTTNLADIMNIDGFAKGGIVTGPTTALIGEGSGTSISNPEVVAPLDKLKQYMGGGSQNVVVTGKIVGNDIWLSNEKTQFNRQRTT